MAKSTPSTMTRPRRVLSLRFGATVMLATALCGAIAAVFVFYGVQDTHGAKSISATAHSVKGFESANKAAATSPKCEIKHCKAGDSEVCGTDGKTYLNECFFQNAQCKNPTLKAVEDWPGYNCPNDCKKPIACKEIGKFLCASDGNVYFGYCNLYVAQCLDPTITEVPCDPAIFKGVFV